MYDPYGRSIVLDDDFSLDGDGESDFAWEYRFTSQKWDSETGLHEFNARYYHDGLGRFIGRDPGGYIDGYSLYAGYFAMYFDTDPTGYGRKRGSGHHVVPWSAFNGKVSDEVFDVFNGDDARLFDECYTNHNYGPAGGVKHSEYNKAVQEELDEFLKKKGKSIDKLTPAEAKEFANKIKNMPPTSTIGKFNAGIKKQIKEAIEKAAKEASQKAGKALAMKCCKKGVGAAVRKIPVCTFVFFCYDTYQGGLGHAVNEAVWPVSEFWAD